MLSLRPFRGIYCMMLLGVISPASLVSLNAQTNSDWVLVWWDEFNQDGAPDPSRWDYEVGYLRNNESQYYTENRPENVRVENGNLILEARRDFWEGHEYTSGSLTTRNTANWTYGRFEVRAKLPQGRGMWTAIWMLGRNVSEVGWPMCGEIDIMENVGYSPEYVHANVHTAAHNHANGTATGGSHGMVQPWEDFHLYAIEWYPDRIDFFFDNTKYFTYHNEGIGAEQWPFFQDQYLLLNAAVGGSWGGIEGIDNSIFPQQFQIDYVRVYEQRKPGPYTLKVIADGPGQVYQNLVMETYPEGTQVNLQADPNLGMRFSGWRGAILDPVYKNTITMNRDIVITAHFVAPGEMLSNGTFSKGKEHWYGPWPSGGAEANVNVSNGELVVEMINPGSAAYNIQVLQHTLTVEQGKTYVLSFDAWSSVPCTVPVGVNMTISPWTLYGGIDAVLTTERKRFSKQFTMQSPTDANCRVEFNFGMASGTVHVDDVMLVCLDDRNLSPYEAWQINHGIRPARHDEDLDGDGLPAIIEYAYGRRPDHAEGPLYVPRISDNTFSLGLPSRAPGTEDVSIVVERSEELTRWTPITGDAIDIRTYPRSFLRMVATPTNSL